jgi:L-fuculose-phosphate aldolase
LPTPDLDRERELILAAARRLAAEGLVLGTAGNLSVQAGESVAITASGARLSELGPAGVTVVGRDGEATPGAPAPSSEIALHLGIYRAHGAGAVVHTHPPVASALASVLDEVPVVHYQMMWLGGSIRVAPYATFGTERLAELALTALQGRNAALLANHGAITYGPDLETAVQRTLLLEWACTVYWRAAALGTPRTLGVAEQRDVLAAL